MLSPFMPRGNLTWSLELWTKNCHTTHSIHLHPWYIWSNYSPQYTNAHSTFPSTVQSDVSLACLQQKKHVLRIYSKTWCGKWQVLLQLTATRFKHLFHITQIPTA